MKLYMILLCRKLKFVTVVIGENMKKSFFGRYASALTINSGLSKSIKDMKWYESSVPCRTACPADTDIPGYLEAIYNKDYDKAYQINLEDNVFPGILGRVCSRPCEDSCRHGDESNGESVSICFSKRSAENFNFQKNFKLKDHAKKTRKNILVIGSGVAGLTAARELTRCGHTVEIYEKHKSPGGMLNQGIPIFRLPRNVIDKEIKQVIQNDIKIHYNKNIKSCSEVRILADKYDAVVLALGTLKSNKINQEFTESHNVENGLEFLLRVNEFRNKHIGKNVIVIGGGYTGMDCARTALRLGAKSVRTFYRRTKTDLVILPGELDELINENGKMIFNARPLNIIKKNNKLIGLELIKTKIVKRDGVYRLVDIKGSSFIVKTDHIILAIGQKQHLSLTKNKLNNIFSVGDFATGATTLINAIAHSKNVVRYIDNFLMGRDLFSSDIKVTKVDMTGRSLKLNYVPIHKMPTTNLDKRTFSCEVEKGYAKNESHKEASRCYLCHYKFEINNDLCVLCDECLIAKPIKDCIVEVSDVQEHPDGDISYKRINPDKTIGIYHGKLLIDHKKCVRCGECEKVCPTNAISIQKVEKQNYVKI